MRPIPDIHNMSQIVLELPTISIMCYVIEFEFDLKLFQILNVFLRCVRCKYVYNNIEVVIRNDISGARSLFQLNIRYRTPNVLWFEIISMIHKSNVKYEVPLYPLYAQSGQTKTKFIVFC